MASRIGDCTESARSKQHHNMIPRRIHYCAFGNRPMTALMTRCIASWRRHLPDYDIKRWDETNSPLDVPYCRAAVAKKQWSRLSNYVRLHALLEEGGIYLDTDMEIIRNLDPLLEHDCFVAFQQESRHKDWVNNAALGSEAGHPFLSRCIALTLKAFDGDGLMLRSPTVTTAVLVEAGLRLYGAQRCGDVSILPCETFYPFPWYSRFTPECITEQTFGIHHWATSWHVGRMARLIHSARRMRYSTINRLRGFH